MTIGYHGSPNKFTKFNTNEVFLAKDKWYAKNYGTYIYKVEFKGKPKFETETIYVIDPSQVVSMTFAAK